MWVSVLTLFCSEQWISTRSFILNFEFTADESAGAIAQVRPATVIELDDRAVIVPCASLFSGFGFEEDEHLPGVSSTALPPLVPPPSLPLVKPLAGLNAADRFATRRAPGSCARPAARPAMLPWSYTAE